MELKIVSTAEAKLAEEQVECYTPSPPPSTSVTSQILNSQLPNS